MSKETNSLLVQILIKNMHLTQILDKIRMCYFFSDIAAMEDFMLVCLVHLTDMAIFRITRTWVCLKGILEES